MIDFPFKLIIDADRGGWSQLSKGTIFLLRARGVRGYDNAFDYAMLESQLSSVVCMALNLLASFLYLMKSPTDHGPALYS